MGVTDETFSGRVKRWLGRSPQPRVVVHTDRFELYNGGWRIGEIRWADIGRITAFKRGMFDFDVLCLDVWDRSTDMAWLVSDDIHGFYDLAQQLNRTFQLDGSWAPQVQQSGSYEEPRVLFDVFDERDRPAPRTVRPGIQPARARQLLADWFAHRQAHGVTFREVLEPDAAPGSDYHVAYEAIFEPASLDRAYVELSVTTEGDVSVGFETRERIAKRLGIRYTGHRVADGHDPVPITGPGLEALLGSVASGDIAIVTRVIPFLGLVSTNALMLREPFETLVSSGYRSSSWLRVVPQFKSSTAARVVTYLPW